jgi:hypothetical protein
MSTTVTSNDAFVDCSFSPNCSWSAVKKEGAFGH